METATPRRGANFLTKLDKNAGLPKGNNLLNSFRTSLVGFSFEFSFLFIVNYHRFECHFSVAHVLREVGLFAWRKKVFRLEKLQIVLTETKPALSNLSSMQ